MNVFIIGIGLIGGSMALDIKSIYEDKTGKLWIGTKGNGLLMSETKFKKLPAKSTVRFFSKDPSLV